MRAHLGNHDPVTMAAASTIVVAALLLVPFLASLRTFTARRTDVAQWPRTVTLVVGAIGLAMLVSRGRSSRATLLARSRHEAVFAVFGGEARRHILAHPLSTSKSPPSPWSPALRPSSTTTGSHPAKPSPAGAWFLVALWVVALARTIVRGDDVIFSEEGS